MRVRGRRTEDEDSGGVWWSRKRIRIKRKAEEKEEGGDCGRKRKGRA